MDSSDVELAPQDFPTKLEIKTNEDDIKPNYVSVEIPELKHEELIVKQDTSVYNHVNEIKSKPESDETLHRLKVETVLIKQEDGDAIQIASSVNPTDSNTDAAFRSKIFKCNLCEYVSPRTADLKRHMVVHSEEKPFACDKCPFRTNTKQNLAAHQAKHCGKKPFKCTQCDYKGGHGLALSNHHKKHHEPYVCDSCNFSSNMQSTFRKHMKLHKTYVCKICNANFTGSSGLLYHMDAHNRVKCYRCDKCSFSSQDINQLATHMKTHLK